MNEIKDNQVLSNNSGIRTVFSIAAIWWVYLTFYAFLNAPFTAAISASLFILVGFMGSYFFVVKRRVVSCKRNVWTLVIFLVYWKLLIGALLIENLSVLMCLFVAILGGIAFLLLIGSIQFVVSFIRAIRNGERHYVTSTIGDAFAKLKGFRIRTMGQRIALIAFIPSGIATITIALNTPHYRRYGDGFWFSFSLTAVSLIFLFGWFSVVMPFFRWIKTGEVPEWINSLKKSLEDFGNMTGKDPEIYSKPVDDGIFPEGTKFYDVLGVPVTFQLNKLGLPVCSAWDICPPREITYEDIRQNGKEISREIFDGMVEHFLTEIQ